MKKELLISAVVGAALVLLFGGIILYSARAPKLSGDFPGGIVPNQLWTGNIASSSVSPVSGLPNLSLTGSFSIGGTAAANQITALYTATTTYPASSITLGNYQQSSSTTSTIMSFTAPGFSVGDSCGIAYAGAPTSTQFGADGFVTAVNGNAVSSTITVWNGAGGNLTLNSSTLKATCVHAGV